MKSICPSLVMALLGVFTCLEACSDQYSAASINAQVVDAETGKPVEGANVVAEWQLEGGLAGGTPVGAVNVMETQTDRDGRFHFPAWGPRKVHKPWGLYANARIRNDRPKLMIFKSGYLCPILKNYGNTEGTDQDPMHSDWDGKIIKLQPFRGTPVQYATALWDLSNDLNNSTANLSPTCQPGNDCPAACQWENIPMMIQSVGRQFALFGSEGVHDSSIFYHLVANDALYRKLGCASPAPVLGKQSSFAAQPEGYAGSRYAAAVEALND